MCSLQKGGYVQINDFILRKRRCSHSLNIGQVFFVPSFLFIFFYDFKIYGVLVYGSSDVMQLAMKFCVTEEERFAIRDENVKYLAIVLSEG